MLVVLNAESRSTPEFSTFDLRYQQIEDKITLYFVALCNGRVRKVRAT